MRNLWLPVLLATLLVSACGGGSSSGDGVQAAAPSVAREYGPDGSFYGPPADGSGKSLATQWPILLSHPWSYTAEKSFRGDELDSTGQSFEPYGVKNMLEAAGAVVFQPDKIAYGSNENRGKLLYKKCGGATLQELLCEGENPQVVDGVHLAIGQYCADGALRARHAYADENECRRKLQFNVICHSQGCPDSRYMLAAIHNEYSGELMYKHVLSWTSMAGANKGTAQADWYLEMTTANCATPGCSSPLLDLAFSLDSLAQNQALITNGNESVIALSTHYMLYSTDMDCDPRVRADCPPSFNQRYPLPEDPSHPVFYQTFTSQIDDIYHPCYLRNLPNWQVVADREGANDGNISVESQRFTTYGPGGTGGATPVLDRWVFGATIDPSRAHPGLNHMAYADSKVPGMNDGSLSCAGEDNSAFRFSRLGLYRDIVAELVARGF